MAGGTGFSAVGAYNQAQGQKDAYNYQASVSQSNVTIAQEQARQAILSGQQDEQTQQLKNAQTFSSQRTAMAANGIDIASSGSAIDVLASTKYLGQRDVLTIHDNALRQAWGHGVEATNYQNETDFYKYAAKQTSPAKATLAPLLGGASQVASKWYDLKKAGAFD